MPELDMTTIMSVVSISVVMIVAFFVIDGIESQATIVTPATFQNMTCSWNNEMAIGLASLNTTSRGILSPASADFSFSGSAGIGLTGSNEMHYLSVDHNSLIRQEGTIKGIMIETDSDFNSASLTGFYISAWRLDGSTYDELGITSNIITDLKAASGSGVEHLINFDPGDYITVEEGDYVGYSFIGSGTPTLEAINAEGEASGVSTRFFNGTDPGTTNIDWNSQSSLNDWANIRVMMDSPSIVFLGQSITSGNLAHNSYINDAGPNDPTTSISYKVGDTLGVSTQNFGNAINCSPCRVIDGVNAMPEVISVNPKVLVVSYGNNDVFVTDATTFKSRLQTIVDDAQSNGITPVLSKIIKNDQNGAWNGAIEDIAETEGISIIDPTPPIVDTHPTSCSYTDYKSGYTSDGAHLTEIAHAEVADMFVNAVDPVVVKTIELTPASTTGQTPLNTSVLVLVPIALLGVILMRVFKE